MGREEGDGRLVVRPALVRSRSLGPALLQSLLLVSRPDITDAPRWSDRAAVHIYIYIYYIDVRAHQGG